jgi:hypothetical protein
MAAQYPVSAAMKRILLVSLPVLACLASAGCNRPSVPLPSNAETAAQSTPTRAAAVQFVPANAPVAWTAVSTCNFEQIDGQAYSGKPIGVKKGAEFLMTGFLFSAPSKSVPQAIRLRAISEDGAHAYEAPVAGRYDRPDVPGYFKIGDWALHSGLEQLLSSQGLPVGKYHLLLVFEDKGQSYVCDNGRQLAVTP